LQEYNGFLTEYYQNNKILPGITAKHVYQALESDNEDGVDVFKQMLYYILARHD
jgi:hypothetical protein